MIFKINSELFYEKSDVTKIDRLLDFVIERRYDLFFDDEEVLDKSHWITEARANYKELLYESFINTIQESKKFDIELSKDDDLENRQFSLDNGIIYLENKVIIFLENAKYDKYFIKGLSEKFKKRAKRIRFFIEKRWIEFKHCGGKNDAINQITQVLENYDLEPLNSYQYVRALVILDSDKKKKNDLDESRVKSEKIISDFCNTNKILIHFLEKREMENYLPFGIIENIANLKEDRLEILRNATRDEKDFFDFETLSTKEYRTKQEFPKLFLDENLTQTMLITECSHQDNPEELEMILDKINSLI